MASVKHESSSDEEPDYMSEEFLKQCTSNDVRPSLVHNRAEKRKLDVYKRQHEINKTKADREKERLKSVEDALKVPISEDNKGFKMLQKMGYKPGASIGKEKDDPLRKGITAPIEIELKQGRGGLGRERHELEKFQKSVSLVNPDEYRLRQQNAALEREISYDLKKAQFACLNLDEESGKTQPSEPWFWPKAKKSRAEKDVQFDFDPDDDDSTETAPVPNKRPKTDEDDDSTTSSSEDEEEDLIPNDEKLSTIADYLRSHYFYCLWCGTKFDNLTDMQSSCPGVTKDDH